MVDRESARERESERMRARERERERETERNKMKYQKLKRQDIRTIHMTTSISERSKCTTYVKKNVGEVR